VQSAAPEHPTLRPHRMAVGTFDLGPQGLVRRGRVELDVTGERLTCRRCSARGPRIWCCSTTTT